MRKHKNKFPYGGMFEGFSYTPETLQGWDALNKNLSSNYKRASVNNIYNAPTYNEGPFKGSYLIGLPEEEYYVDLNSEQSTDNSYSGIMEPFSVAASGLTGILGGAINNSKFANTENIENRINNYKEGFSGFNSSTNTGLMSEYANLTYAPKLVTREELTPSAKERTKNYLTSIASGATSGAKVGGLWGGIIGGFLGLGAAGIGDAYRNSMTDNKTSGYNTQIQKEKERQLREFNNKAEEVDSNNDLFAKMNAFAEGGEMFPNNITTINNGGTHEQNPFEGVPVGIDNEGTPNLVEEDEVIFENYVFSNRLKANKKLLSKVNLPEKYEEKTFADIAKVLSKESEERPNDPISKRGLEDSMNKLQQAQEEVRMKKETKRKYSKGGNLYANGTWLRYAPIAGSLVGLGIDSFSKPDYSRAEAIEGSANKIADFAPVEYTPINNYLQYTPFDRNFYITKLNAEAGATRRTLNNTSSPSKYANILAADYNFQTKLGDLARQAEEYNFNQRKAIEEFNRGTNTFNSEMALKVAQANQDAYIRANNARLAGIQAAMKNRDDIDALRSASISSNLTNLFDSLGSMGNENFIMNQINSNPGLLYSLLGNGSMNYKKGNTREKADGGYLTIKKRRRHA